MSTRAATSVPSSAGAEIASSESGDDAISVERVGDEHGADLLRLARAPARGHARERAIALRARDAHTRVIDQSARSPSSALAGRLGDRRAQAVGATVTTASCRGDDGASTASPERAHERRGIPHGDARREHPTDAPAARARCPAGCAAARTRASCSPRASRDSSTSRADIRAGSGVVAHEQRRDVAQQHGDEQHRDERHRRRAHLPDPSEIEDDERRARGEIREPECSTGMMVRWSEYENAPPAPEPKSSDS